MREHRGFSYMRTTREKTPVLYEPEESFEIGGSRTLRSGDDDAVTLIGAGITLHECLTAADELAAKGIAARVIDLYSVKPVDADALLEAADETRALITVEDHWAEGGIGETVAGVLARAGAARRWSASPSPSVPAAARRRRCSPPPASTPRTSSARSSRLLQADS